MSKEIDIVVKAITKGFDQLSKDLKSVGEDARKTKLTLSDVGEGMKDVGQKATLGLTVPLVAAGVASVKALSDLDEAINATNVTFEEASQTVLDFSETTATSLGLSQRAFLQAATPLGASLQNLGLNAQDAADWTVKLASRASDMASVFNTDVNDALSAISSMIRGERDPIERYGVGINEAALKAYALANGLGSATGEMDMQQKAMASLQLLMEQTSKTAGDFSNTSKEIANNTRIAKAQLEEAAVAIGNQLLPVASAGVNVISDFVTAFADLDPAMQGAVVSLSAITAGIGPMLTGVGTAITSYQSLEKAVAAAGLSMKAVAVTAGAVAAAVVAATAAGAKFVEFEKMQEQGAKNVSDSWDKMFESVITGGGDAGDVLDAYGKKQEQFNQILDNTNILFKWQIESRTNAIDTEQKLFDAISRSASGYTEYRDAIMQAQEQGYLLDVTQQEVEAQFYRTRDASAKYRSAVQELTSATLENTSTVNTSRDAHNQYTYAIDQTAAAQERGAEKALENEAANRAMFESLDTNLSGTIQKTLEKINFLNAGGRELQEQFEQAYAELVKDPGDPGARLQVERIYNKAKRLEDVLISNVEKARRVGEANKEMFESLDTGLDSSIKNALEKLEWLKAGGGELQIQFESAYDALTKDPGDPAAKQKLEDLYVMSEGLKVKLGDIKADEAAENISKTLGVSLENANKMLEGIKDDLAALEGSVTTTYVDIVERVKTPYGTTGGKRQPAPGSEHIPTQYGGTLDTGATGQSSGSFGASSNSASSSASTNVAAINIYQQPGENASALAKRVARELNTRSKNAYNAGSAGAGVG